MAWMAAHLFVPSEEATSVEKTLEQLLAVREHEADQEGLSDLPPPIIVTPPFQGWQVITGAAGWLDDLGWAAAQLSSSDRARAAVSCEIFGNCYRLRLQQFKGGKREQHRELPAQPGASGMMPLYDDVEQIAYGALRELGIAPPLIAVGTKPFGLTGAALPLGQGTALVRRGGAVERQAVALELPPFAGEDAPVLPHQVSQDFGLMLFEDRYLEGQPSEAALDRLIAIEEAMLQRARARNTSSAEVTLTMTYHAGVDQPKLDALLRARNRHTLPVDQQMRPPWWAFWRHFGRVR